jgi:hypothetical protein
MVNKPFRVIHLEDNPDWRSTIESSLRSRFPELDYVPFQNLNAFLSYQGSYGANLYISDRHVPTKDGESPNDEAWRRYISILACTNPSVPAVIVSRKVPAEHVIKRFNSIKGSMQKDTFDSDKFIGLVTRVCSLEVEA